jgi:hypothetical protein
MGQVQLSDVQLSNLTMLLSIRDGIHQDRLQTCCRYALDAEQADRFGDLGVHQIMAIVANVGSVTLFPPRRDLTALLDLPLPLTRPMATVHAFRPGSPQ